MAREIWIESQVESYQRLKKLYLMLSCLILSIIRYVSRVKWSNPGKGVAPSPTPRCSSYRKGSLLVTLDYGRQQQQQQHTVCKIVIIKNKGRKVTFIKVYDNYSYLQELDEQYLPILYTDRKMVIIKIKGHRVTFIKVFLQYLFILHMGSKMVFIKNKVQWILLSLNGLTNY